MSDLSQNNKRLAKNTLLLYVRTAITLCMGLYTSRLTLEVLGVEDFGVYNIVGGLVGMFVIFSGTMTNAVTRFIAFEVGHGNKKRLNDIFSTSINIQCLIIVFVLILSECIGLWFINCKMNVPSDRVHAANWVFQFSLLTFCNNLLSIPYNAAIVAHEHLQTFAYFSIAETSVKLAIVVLLSYMSSYDTLIAYGLFMLLLSIAVRSCYRFYCSRLFDECHYHFVWRKDLIKEMLSFSGWNFVTTGAYICNTNGVDLLSNVFFGVGVNAARGVANQGTSAVRQFIGNFTTALNPQIIKSYAEGNRQACFSLVNMGAKLSYFLMLFFFIPLALEAETVLSLWLKNVPEYAVMFFQLSLLGVLVDLPGAPLTILIQATGDLKKYSIYMTVFGCLILPITYILYHMGFPSYTPYVVYAVVYTYLVYVRLIIARQQVGFNVLGYLRDVIAKVLLVTVVSALLPIAIVVAQPVGMERLVVVFIASTVSISLSVWLLGLDSVERAKVLRLVGNRIPFLR